MHQLNYHHLYYFYVTAREGSIAKASQLLHVTPQTVSGQIATFEDNLGFPLFDRRGKRLYLNTQGKIAYESAENIFTNGQHLVETLFANEHGHTHQFNIGITDVVPKVLAFDFVKDVMKNATSTRFVFKEGDFETLVGDLAVNKLDMVVSDRPILPGTSIKALSHFLGDTGVSFFAKHNTDYLAAHFPKSLDKAPMLLSGDKSRMKMTIEAWFEENQIRPMVIAEFDDSALLKLFGGEGFGIFCAPSSIKKDVEAQYDVTCVGSTNSVTERYYAITGEGRTQHSMVKQVLTSAKALFKDHT